MIGYRGKLEQNLLLQSVKKRKLSYYGHLLRKEGNCMEKEIMQSTILLTRWQDNITKWNGLTGDRLLKTEGNGRRLSMKRPILGSRTAERKGESVVACCSVLVAKSYPHRIVVVSYL